MGVRKNIPNIWVNEEWSFQIDVYGWMVHQWHEVKKGTGTGKFIAKEDHKKEVTTYHANLRQAAAYILDRITGPEEKSLQEVVEALDRAEIRLAKKMEKLHGDQEQV